MTTREFKVETMDRSNHQRHNEDEQGEDTGTPVVEDYVDKMPFKFTGDLKKIVIELGKSGLAATDEKSLEGAKRALAARE